MKDMQYIEYLLEDSPMAERNQFFIKLKEGLPDSERNLIDNYLTNSQNRDIKADIIDLIYDKIEKNPDTFQSLKSMSHLVNHGITNLGGRVIITAEKSAGRDMIVNNAINFKPIIFACFLLIIGYLGFTYRNSFVNYFNLFDKFETSNYKTLNIALIPFNSDVNLTTQQGGDFMNQLIDRLNTYADSSTQITIIHYKRKSGISNHLEARKFGTLVNADLVIWGTYSMGNDSTNVRLCYTLLKEIGLSESSQTNENSSKVSTINLTSTLREGNLPNNVFFVLNWVKGMDYYFKGLYKMALFHIDLIKQDKGLNLDSETSNLLGNIYKDLGKYELALQYYNSYLEKKNRDFSPIDSVLIDIYRSIGFCHASLQQYQEAVEYYSKAEQIVEILETHNKEVAMLYNDIGILNKDMSLQFDDHLLIDTSIFYYNKSIAIWQSNFDTNNYSYILTLNNLAVSLDIKNKILEAKKFHEIAINKFEHAFAVDKPQLATLYNNFAKHCLLEGDTIKSEQYLLKSIGLMEVSLDPQNINLAGGYNNLSKVYFYQKKYTEALLYAHKSLTILESSGKHILFKSIVFKNLGDIYKASNQPRKSIYYLQQYTNSKK